jgi:hypothetical protein
MRELSKPILSARASRLRLQDPPTSPVQAIRRIATAEASVDAVAVVADAVMVGAMAVTADPTELLIAVQIEDPSELQSVASIPTALQSPAIRVLPRQRLRAR